MEKDERITNYTDPRDIGMASGLETRILDRIQSEHHAEVHLSDEASKLATVELKPLHILYLAAIFEGDFDSRLHKGHFALAPVFSQRIGELLNMGLIKYDGRHAITPRGVAHMEQLCAVRVKP